MPKVCDDIGPYHIFFYSNEHEPEHVHIERDDAEVKIELFSGPKGKPKLVDNKGMKKSDVRAAMKIVKNNRNAFLQKWNEYYA